MKENTKRVIDWLALPALGLPAAVMCFDYVNNIHPSKLWIVLLMFDFPFGAAAFIWLCWRIFNGLPKTERTKSVIDWLTLIPLGYMPASLVWVLYTHNNSHPSAIAFALLIIHIPFVILSILWLSLRAATVPNRAYSIVYGWLAIVVLLLLLVAPHKHQQTW